MPWLLEGKLEGSKDAAVGQCRVQILFEQRVQIVAAGDATV